jgi:transcription elongation GreA/GreB family factor
MSKIRLGDEFWKSRLDLRDEKIAELEQRVHDLEAQLSTAFEIMTDKQIANNQHLFNSTLHIEDSASTDHTQKGER